MNPHELESAYRHCEALARAHYENFPVASRLLPSTIRRPVAVIYAFARIADDYADEGELSPAQRLSLLDKYSEKLQRAGKGEDTDDPVFIALREILAIYDLPLTLFTDLLSAFRQDVTTKRYADFTELLDYCRRSANPVGRLLLHLNGDATAENLAFSDNICTALQLINFCQDLAQDYDENQRIYLPQDEMARFGIGSHHFSGRIADENMQQLLHYQLGRARRLMQDGAPLGRRLKGRFGLEIRLIIQGGLAVIARLEKTPPFSRPRLRKRDWLRAAIAAI